jgi:hypothetical protein
MKQLLVVLSCGLMVATAAPVMAQAGAQKDSAKKGSVIPADARPPKGMCRIWIE